MNNTEIAWHRNGLVIGYDHRKKFHKLGYNLCTSIYIYIYKNYMYLWLQYIWLVVSTPLKNMSSSIGMMTFPYGKIKVMFQSPPTRCRCLDNVSAHHITLFKNHHNFLADTTQIRQSWLHLKICWLFDITMVTMAHEKRGNGSQVLGSNDGDGKPLDIAGKTTGNCWETMGKWWKVMYPPVNSQKTMELSSSSTRNAQRWVLARRFVTQWGLVLLRHMEAFTGR